MIIQFLKIQIDSNALKVFTLKILKGNEYSFINYLAEFIKKKI
jgi:hypothetical protein